MLDLLGLMISDWPIVNTDLCLIINRKVKYYPFLGVKDFGVESN